MGNGVSFQTRDPATPPASTVIKTTKGADGHVQHVNVDSMPNVVLSSTTDTIGAVEITSMPNITLNSSTDLIGAVEVMSIAAGDNNIGNFDLASSIPSGTNNIGDVDVASIAAGTNTIGKVILTDNYGFQVEATPMDELRVVTPVRLAGSTFVGTTIDTNFWTATATTDGASVTIGSGQAVVETVTSTDSAASIESMREGRYIGASSNRYRAQIQLSDSGQANNTRRWGAYDADNGAFFELNGTTLKVVTRKATVDTAVSSSDWNGSTTTPTLTNVNSYEIYYTNAKVYFVIAGTLKHTVSASSATWAATLNLHVRAESLNTDTTAGNSSIQVRVNTISRMGQEQTSPIMKHITGEATTLLKRGPGSLHRIVVNKAGTLCSIYDAVSDTDATLAIGLVDINKTTGTIGAIDYDGPFYNGLTITTTGSGADLTIVYE